MSRTTKKPIRKRRPTIIEEAGIKVRLFRRGAQWWGDVRVDGDRHRERLKTTERSTAENNARAWAKEIAEQRLTGVTPDTLSLGQMFRTYGAHRLPALKPPRQREAETRIAMFLEAWGAALSVLDIDQTRIDAYCTKRRRSEVLAPVFKPTDDGKRKRGYRQPKAVRDGALHSELSWLSTCCNWACGFKVQGKRLLHENPLRGLDWPKEKNPRRPVASHARYVRTLEHADAIDPQGRLRCVLALARYTGRRESAICGLHANDLLLSTRRIREALATAGMDERLAEHMPHGAIRWRAEADKQGFLFVSPINPEARTELDRYLSGSGRVGDIPLFPAPGRKRKKDAPPPLTPDPERPIRRDTALAWLQRAEQRAELPKLVGGAFHPYRRLWASERKHMPDVDVAAAGGWRDTVALRRSYQAADPSTVLRVVEGA